MIYEYEKDGKYIAIEMDSDSAYFNIQFEEDGPWSCVDFNDVEECVRLKVDFHSSLLIQDSLDLGDGEFEAGMFFDWDMFVEQDGWQEFVLEALTVNK